MRPKLTPWLAVLLCGFATVWTTAGVAQAPAKRTTGQTGAAKRKPAGTAAKPQRPRGGFVAPGVAGAIPRKPTPAPGVRIGPPGLPPVLFPAPVAPPNAPGLPGLQPRAANPLIYGVNAVWGDNGGTANWNKDGGAKARRLAQLIKAGGFTCTRIRIDWAGIERRRGVYDWAETDRFVAFVRKLGVTPVCLVGATPDWATDQSPETLRLFRERGVSNLAAARAPDAMYLTDLQRFAEKCAARYKGAIRHWEFWNEPDAMGMPVVVRGPDGRPTDIRYGGDAAVYVSMLKAFSAGVRKGDPEARVAVGGLQVLTTEFLEAIYANEGRDAFDAVALHPYNGNNVIAFDWIDRCRQVAESRGDAAKPFWLTEWGWPAQGTVANPLGVSEGHQARLVRESLAGIRERRYITQASYHTLNDWRTDEKDPSTLMTTGLTSYAMAPRPAFHAFREAAAGAPPVPVRAYARAMLTGPPDGPGAVRVTVDASAPTTPVPPLWSAFAQPLDPGLPSMLQRWAGPIRRLGAAYIRIDPLSSGSAVTAGPDGLRIDWTATDAAVAAIERTGARPVFSFGTAPEGFTGDVFAARWANLATEAARRYTVSQERRVPYWEFALEPGTGPAAEAHWLAAYEAFARAVRSVDPQARVGGPARASFDQAQLARLARECATRAIPMQFVSWRATAQPPAEVARQVVDLRSALQGSPGTRGMEIVLSEWSMSSRATPVNDAMPAAMYVASLAESLAGAGSVLPFGFSLVEQARGATNLWGGWSALAADGRPKAAYNALLLLSKLVGARVPASTEDTAVHALAARGPSSVAVLVWRDADTGTDGEAGMPDAPVTVRVAGMPWTGAAVGAVTVLDDRHGSVATEGVSPHMPGPVLFSAPAGAVEASIAVPPGRISLVEFRPAPTPPAQVTVASPAYVVYPGTMVPVRVSVRNPRATPLSVTLEMGASEEAPVAAARDRTRRVVVAAGGESTVAFQIKPAGRRPGAREYLQVKATVDGEKTPIWGAAAIQVAGALEARLTAPRIDVFEPAGMQGGARPTGSLRVALVNRGGAPANVRVWSGRTEANVRVAAGKSAEASLTVSAPATAPGLYPVTVRVEEDGKPLPSLAAVVGVPAQCVRAVRTPRIDGNLDEWETAQRLPLEREDQTAGRQWGGLRDVSARLLTMYDTRFLYVAAEVTDDVHHQPYPDNLMWQADSLQFAIDTARDADPLQVGYGAGDFEVCVSTGPGGGRIVRLHPAGGALIGARASVRREGEKTLYEVALPWTALGGLKPFAGGIVGFSALVNDSDGRGRGYIAWGGGIADSKRPGQFIGLRFAR